MAIQLLAGLLTILIGAELFTNGVEWLGNRLGLSEGTVGNLQQWVLRCLNLLFRW